MQVIYILQQISRAKTHAMTSTQLINILPQSDKDRSFIQRWKWSKTHWCSAGPQFEAKASHYQPHTAAERLVCCIQVS